MRYNLLTMLSIEELTQEVKQQAYRLGFSLVGVTTSDPLPHGKVFEDWLHSGRQGEMAYLDTSRSRDCRPHPGRLLPGCRSVLALGVRYPTPLPGENKKDDGRPGLHGKIAAYAWGPDYHEFLPARLQGLVQFIEEKVGHAVPNRCYTDTGPLLERELAQRAGLGWIGKNTCLINPHQGSYFLLAEILLGTELAPEAPFADDRCGTCTRCIQACPTGCILPDRTLDARRCISYLTIELKGIIPPELRPLLGSWVFGCDVCQQVCPWNHFADAQADLAFADRLVEPEPDLLQALALSAQGFNRKYRHSTLRRARRRGYLRNVAVALGNLPNPQAMPPLVYTLEFDPDPLVRLHAAWALGQIGTILARQALHNRAIRENDSLVKLEIGKALQDDGQGI